MATYLIAGGTCASPSRADDVPKILHDNTRRCARAGKTSLLERDDDSAALKAKNARAEALKLEAGEVTLFYKLETNAKIVLLSGAGRATCSSTRRRPGRRLPEEVLAASRRHRNLGVRVGHGAVDRQHHPNALDIIAVLKQPRHLARPPSPARPHCLRRSRATAGSPAPPSASSPALSRACGVGAKFFATAPGPPSLRRASSSTTARGWTASRRPSSRVATPTSLLAMYARLFLEQRAAKPVPWERSGPAVQAAPHSQLATTTARRARSRLANARDIVLYYNGRPVDS